MALIPPRLDALFRNKVKGLIKDLSKRNRTFILITTSAQCPNCLFNTTTGTGSGVYNGRGDSPFDGRVCPICENVGKINTESKTPLIANIQFGKKPDPNRPLPEGELRDGEAIINFLPNDVKRVQANKHYMIDSVRYTKVGEDRTRGLLTVASGYIKVQRDD